MTSKYHLLLSLSGDQQIDHVHALATELCGVDPAAWSAPSQERTQGPWLSQNGAARVRLMEGRQDPAGEQVPGWIELSGLASGGRVRWVQEDPPSVVMIGLSDPEIDAVWGRERAVQAKLLGAWVRERGPSMPRQAPAQPAGTLQSLKSLVNTVVPRSHDVIPDALPRVASPPFAPEKVAEWLFSGEVSSLGRYVDEADAVLAGIAAPVDPGGRLLIRPLHRLGAQSLVPVTVMQRGHKFAGLNVVHTVATAKAFADRLREPLSKLCGVTIPSTPPSRLRETRPSAVAIVRFGELEHGQKQPFAELGAVSKAPGSDVALRLVEVRTDFAAPGRPSAIFELEASGLPGGSKLFATAVGSKASGFRVRVFALGPPDQTDDLLTVVEQALKTRP